VHRLAQLQPFNDWPLVQRRRRIRSTRGSGRKFLTVGYRYAYSDRNCSMLYITQAPLQCPIHNVYFSVRPAPPILFLFLPILKNS